MTVGRGDLAIDKAVSLHPGSVRPAVLATDVWRGAASVVPGVALPFGFEWHRRGEGTPALRRAASALSLAPFPRPLPLPGVTGNGAAGEGRAQNRFGLAGERKARKRFCPVTKPGIRGQWAAGRGSSLAPHSARTTASMEAIAVVTFGQRSRRTLCSGAEPASAAATVFGDMTLIHGGDLQ